MADQFELVKQYLTALKPSNGADPEPRTDLLADDARFRAVLVNLDGRDAVIERMARSEFSQVYRDVAWSEPEIQNGAVQIVGRLPAGFPTGGVLLRFHFQGDRISLIQQQGIPGAPLKPVELTLTPELQDLIDNSMMQGHPVLVASVNERGQAVLAYRGSIHTFSEHQLGFWVRNVEGNSVRAVESNPHVTLHYRNADTRTTLNFLGRAWVATDEVTRAKIYDAAPEIEQAGDFARLGLAVVVDLQRIDGALNGTRMVMIRGGGQD